MISFAFAVIWTDFNAFINNMVWISTYSQSIMGHHTILKNIKLKTSMYFSNSIPQYKFNRKSEKDRFHRKWIFLDKLCTVHNKVYFCLASQTQE